MHQRILEPWVLRAIEEAAVVLGDTGDEPCSANASIKATRIHEEVVRVRRDAVCHAGKCRQYPRRLCGLGGEVRMNVGDVAPADRRNETRGQDDDREPIHERPRVGRVVEQHVTITRATTRGLATARRTNSRHPRAVEAICTTGSHRFAIGCTGPPRPGRSANSSMGDASPISHGVEFAKYERLGDQREPQDHVRHSGAGRGLAIATGHAVQR